MILPIVAVGFQVFSGAAIVKQVAAKLSHVRALSVTLVTAYTNPPRQVKESFSVLKGGYMRYRQGDSEAVVSPTQAWLIWPAKKQYKQRPAPPKGSPQNPFAGMPGLFGEGILPAIGSASLAKFEGHAALEVEMDPGKVLPRGSKLEFFISQDTKLPLGFRITQGSLIIQGSYSDLKLDPPLKPSDFTFTPGKGWTKFPG